MQALTAIAVLMFVSAITPGPNNLIVLRRASSGGLVAAVPAMTGIVAGGVAMFALAEAGLAALVVDSPRLLTAIVLGGGLYLAYLGIVLMRSSGAPTAAVSAGGGVLAMFAFQFANPKAWVLVMTAVGASRRAGDPQGWLDVATVPALFALISLACLCAWALLGRLASRLTEASSARAWFDRVMGLVLIASAISLLMNE